MLFISSIRKFVNGISEKAARCGLGYSNYSFLRVQELKHFFLEAYRDPEKGEVVARSESVLLDVDQGRSSQELPVHPSLQDLKRGPHN